MFEEFPYHQSILHSAEAVSEELPGLRRGHRRVPHDRPTCPRAARDYLEFIVGLRRRAGQADRRRPGPRPGDLGRRRAAAARGRLSQVSETVDRNGSRTGGGSSCRSSSSRSPRRRIRSASIAGRQQRRGRERDLHADQALARPVDVLQLEQQRGLVERQPDADARAGSRASRAPSRRWRTAPRCRTRTRARCPGTKWWMWRRPMRTLNSSGTPLRTPKVVSRTTLDEITNADSRLNSDGLAGGRLAVAAARDLDRVERGARALLDHLGRGLRLLGDDPPAPELADLAGRHGADRRERDHAHHERAPLERVEPAQRAASRPVDAARSAQQRPRSGTLRAPRARARARPSRPRARARRGSPPRRRRRTPPRRSRRPGVSTAPPPIRARAPAQGRPAQRLARGVAAHRVVVGRDDPGPDEHVVLDHRVRREVAVGLDPHAGADRDVVLDARTRGRSPLPSPTVDALAHLRLVADDRARARCRAPA